MKKHISARRSAQMEAEGVTFHYGAFVGANGSIDPKKLVEQYDAIALTGGAEAGRDLAIPGRDLAGIHFAMDFLPQQNRRVSNERSEEHTSELQSPCNLVCRLLLEKKKDQ